MTSQHTAEHNLCLYSAAHVLKAALQLKPAFRYLERRYGTAAQRGANRDVLQCFPVQPTAAPPSPWRWCVGSCRASPTPSSSAARARTSSWSRAPTTGALTTRSATRIRPRWKTPGATCPTPTRSCHCGQCLNFKSKQCPAKQGHFVCSETQKWKLLIVGCFSCLTAVHDWLGITFTVGIVCCLPKRENCPVN